MQRPRGGRLQQRLLPQRGGAGPAPKLAALLTWAARSDYSLVMVPEVQLTLDINTSLQLSEGADGGWTGQHFDSPSQGKVGGCLILFRPQPLVRLHPLPVPAGSCASDFDSGNKGINRE